MNPVSQKNLASHEAVLYRPQLHWVVFLRPFWLLSISLILLIAEKAAECLKLPVVFPDLRVVFLINLGAAGLWFIWQLIEFYMVEYFVTNKRLIVKKGVFSSGMADLPFDRAEAVFVHRSLWGRLFKYGTVSVSGLGGSQVRFRDVKKPCALRRFIYKTLDRNRDITVIREDEPRPVQAGEGPLKSAPVQDINYGVYVTSYPARTRAGNSL